MEVIRNSQFMVLLYFTFLWISLGSCLSQGGSDVQVTASVEDTQLYESKLDSNLLLNFPNGVRAILEDSHGNIWFGSHSQGLCLFDGEKLTYFTSEDGLSDNQVRSIFEDSNGRVWFECGVGLSSFDGEKIITHTQKNYSFKEEWQSTEDDLWFKGDESTGYNDFEAKPGVYRYDGNALNYHVFPFVLSDNDFSHSISTPFVKGKDGMFWFGTYGAVFGYDGERFTMINNESLRLNEETGYLHVRSIYEDSKGHLWIGNNGIGVLEFNGDTTINFSGSQGLISENSLHSGGYSSPFGSLEHVFAIGEDTNGNMWFGDRDTGAWKYDGKSMTNYGVMHGLSSTHIWQIYNSKNGELWFAMNDGSVMRFTGELFERIF